MRRPVGEKWLTYSAAGGGVDGNDINVEPFPPTGARRPTSADGGLWSLWSPDESELFRRPDTGSERTGLRTVDIVTEPDFGFSKEQTLPVEGFIVVTLHRDYDITSDGEQFLMVFPADEAETGEPAHPQINIVQN